MSHVDCVRAIERAAARASVPLQFSQGFNPHPVLSLAMARPVGVATSDDLAVLAMAEPVEGADLVRDDSLIRDIIAPSSKPDSSGRLILEKKIDIRARLGFSPDGGDAAVLTFAAPVLRRDPAKALPVRANSGYNPFHAMA